MNEPLPPILDEQYRIPLNAGTVSIDALVGNILSHATQFPVRQTASPQQVGEALYAELPRAGVSLQTAVDELMGSAGTYYRKNAHPGMFSFIASPGLPTDALGHALTAALNQNVTGYMGAPGAATVERTMVRWMCQLAGLPQGSDGLMVGGGSLANLSAIATAVHHKLGPGASERGICEGPRPVILAARTAHFSIQRAAVLLGIGRAGIEYIDTDESHRMDLDALAEKLEEISGDPERRACCVVATAGTTAMGVIDPLTAIAEECRRHGVWLHVDAAYGGAALLSPVLRERLKGIESADSITIDLHKWCYLAFDASVLLYRDPEPARDLYAFEADYSRYGRDQGDETRRYSNLSPEVSRRNRALPAYLAWRHYGLDLLGRNVQHNAECAQYLASLVESDPNLKLVGKPELSICCFRYLPQSLHGKDKLVDSLNQRIIEMLAHEGQFLLSPTLIDNRPVLRVCICSHTTRAHHMEELVSEVRRIGNEQLGLEDK